MPVALEPEYLSLSRFQFFEGPGSAVADWREYICDHYFALNHVGQQEGAEPRGIFLHGLECALRQMSECCVSWNEERLILGSAAGTRLGLIGFVVRRRDSYVDQRGSEGFILGAGFLQQAEESFKVTGRTQSVG